MTASVAFDAVVLAGGRGSRLGGIDKATTTLQGERLVDRVVDAARVAGAARVIVAGPAHAGSGDSLVVREDPPFSGPLAAVAAALPHVHEEWLLLLSCDLVEPELASRTLLNALKESQRAKTSRAEPSATEPFPAEPSRAEPSAADGIVLEDDGGRAQWLTGIYRTRALRSGTRELGSRVIDAPLKLLLGDLTLCRLRAPAAATADIDTPSDLQRARNQRRLT